MDTQGLKTIRDWIRWGASQFEAHELFYGHGTDNAFDEVSMLVAHALHLSRGIPADFLDARLTADEAATVVELLMRRIDERKPSAYLVGSAWFCGLSFAVTDKVLVPRSPIAELIETGFSPWVTDARRILDLCTGSGCIAVSCAVHLGATVTGSDISTDAVELAARNAEDHGVEHLCSWNVGDLFQGLDAEKYDLIVSNPPYVGRQEWEELPPEFRSEPVLGLVSGEDGLDIPLRIIRDAADFLTEGGSLILEVGYSWSALEQALPDVPFDWLEFEHGGEGVLHMDHERLLRYRDRVEKVIAERESQS